MEIVKGWQGGSTPQSTRRGCLKIHLIHTIEGKYEYNTPGSVNV